ncbi:RagB/SusD family nutrient uptake outer membrane protein [Hoylesella pleuritidis]|jgi:putative CRISPR-associated protein csc1|uniref:Starch-binding protein, SusD-like family n=1 Tax=Hoylesella pleuritidis F0068 TaxID=1081904 RepID=U2MVT5_9BACT|nr:RagB/SusD family nutrient uptake outer membrane protein [Hoylesella pleuritidis]ERK03324.1 starch-binding protein, SusD-like family [Hoylesella pleuritidis F0068]
MLKQIAIYIIGIGMGSISLASCSLNIPPQDQFSDPDAINNVENARSLLASAYLSYPHYEYELSILGNDFCPTSVSIKDISTLNLYRWEDKEISKQAPTIWLGYYNTISSCDALLERLPQVTTNTEAENKEKQAIEAETKTLKALCYFQLLRIFAPAYDRNAEADGVVIKNFLGLETNKRSSIKACVAYIRQLLTDTEQVKNTPDRNGWLSQTAVKYLLADLALYSSDYQEAANKAQQVIALADNSYFTSDGLNRLWSGESYNGRIFAFNTTSQIYVSIQYSAAEGDYFALNPALNFTDSDVRKAFSVYPFTMDGAVRNLLGKYNKNNKEGKTTTYINQIRYAGAFYIAAEAYCRTGNTNAARTLINRYWKQIGVEEAPADITSDALLDRILLDKQREFVGEGVNFFDLKRTHLQPLARLSRWGSASNANISVDDYRWTFPIPRSEYRFNDNVSQNEGWPINK